MTSDVLDGEAVAAMLRCEETTVEERARRGDLPGLKFGHGWIFPRDALLARLNELALEEAKRRRIPAKGTAESRSVPDSNVRRARTRPVLPTLPTMPQVP
jgi:hypothetical protein